jgi:hypothetical protein
VVLSLILYISCFALQPTAFSDQGIDRQDTLGNGIVVQLILFTVEGLL